MAHHRLTGLTVADTGSPIQTYEQLGGRGTVFNKALAIPMHLGYPWHSLEYVVISPLIDGQESSVGEHLQHTDEIYYIHHGTGVLTTNGISCDVAAGFLAIAPRGTRHGIRNTSSREELALLVVELVPPQDEDVSPPGEIPSLPALLADSAAFHPASLGTREARLRVATVDLSRYCSAPWGRLALLDHNETGLEDLAAALRMTGVAIHTTVADLSTEEGVREGMQAVLAPYGGALDILVPNVGALIAGPFREQSCEQWQQAFAINFFTHVYACRVAVPLMQQRGGGCIVFTGSDQALQPDAGLGPYAQAKAATHCFAKMLARELASNGIRVNVVAPGMTRTPLVEVLMRQRAREFMTDTRTAEQRELSTRGVPLARLGEPEEIAEAVLYLATASFCTGTILNISGGNVRAVMC